MQPHLVLEEDAALGTCAGQVVAVGAAAFEAAQRGTHLATHHALRRQASVVSHFHVHQGAVTRLVHFVRPQRTVQVDPLVHVHVQQSANTEDSNVMHTYQDFFDETCP